MRRNRRPNSPARLQVSSIAVCHARQRTRARGGWWCPLALVTCTECGQPLRGHATVARRQVHARCERVRRARWRRDHPHQQDYDRANKRRWRERYPEHNAAQLARWNARARQEQAETAAKATQRGQRWTAEDDALILSRLDVPTREIALVLGRSTAAVFIRRSRLRREAT